MVRDEGHTEAKAFENIVIVFIIRSTQVDQISIDRFRL